jgi:hypothetical protein
MLKQVVDTSGRPLSGVYKSPNGSIIVKDQEGLNKYLKEKETEQRLANLEDKLDKILQLLSSR